MNFFPISMLRYAGVLLELYSIRRFLFPLAGWTLDGYFQHQVFLVALVKDKENASCHQLLMSSVCYSLYSLLKIVSICNSLWVQYQFNTFKQGLKHPFLIFLLPSMLKYIGLRILWSVCGASMGLYTIHITFGSEQGLN